MRTYYGIEYAYGSHVVNRGNRSDMIVGFTTKTKRDDWAGRGSDYQGAGEREAISRRGMDRLMAKARAREAQVIYIDSERWAYQCDGEPLHLQVDKSIMA